MICKKTAIGFLTVTASSSTRISLHISPSIAQHKAATFVLIYANEFLWQRFMNLRGCSSSLISRSSSSSSSISRSSSPCSFLCATTEHTLHAPLSCLPELLTPSRRQVKIPCRYHMLLCYANTVHHYRSILAVEPARVFVPASCMWETLNLSRSDFRPIGLYI